jgi:hypothetical protein
MAQTSAADKLRPALQIFAKYHFWMLAVIVPCIIVPSLFMAHGHLLKQIDVVREQIKACISSLKSVRGITQHPNPAWSSDIDTSTMRVKRETLAEWQRFWDSQASLRTWPDALGADFVKAATNLKPDGKLSLKLLERYQNMVRSLVRELPGRMGAEDMMHTGGSGGEGRPRPMASLAPPGDPSQSGMRPGLFSGGQSAAPGGEPQASPYNLVWNPTNQQQLYKWFDWETPPTTTMVVMAQEELRVYGVLCDLIARMNKPATGPHNAAIAVVNELLIGYPAATDVVGGATKGRIRSASQQPGGGMGMMSSMDPSGSTEGSGGGKPAHPRFGGGSSSMGSGSSDPAMAEAAPVAAGPTDEALRGWVYVDFNDKPLDGAQLTSAPDATMVHLMPFVMKLVMDQRQIDALLVEMATSPLPIDGRQVRITAAGGPGDAGGMVSAPSPSEGMSGMSGGGPPAGSRIYDVPVEIHGTIGLATQPTEAAVGLEPGQGVEQPAGEGDKSAAAIAAPPFPLRGMVRGTAAAGPAAAGGGCWQRQPTSAHGQVASHTARSPQRLSQRPSSAPGPLPSRRRTPS